MLFFKFLYALIINNILLSYCSRYKLYKDEIRSIGQEILLKMFDDTIRDTTGTLYERLIILEIQRKIIN